MSVAVRSLKVQSPMFDESVREKAEMEKECEEDEGKGRDLAEMVNKPDILNPGHHDVLLGRGGGTNNHIGNKNFRQLVSEHKMRYLAASKMDKPKVAREVVAMWRKFDPPGRFLQRKNEDARGPGSVQDDGIVWVEVCDKDARKKASQCLRERTPDIQPYLAQLRQDQDKMTEEGVSTIQQRMQMKLGMDHKQLPPDTARSGGGKLHNQTGSMSSRLHNNSRGSLRRGSMPASVQPSADSFPNRMPTGNMRLHDRRTSMPAANQLQGARGTDMESLMARQQLVLRDAYTTIERCGEMDNTNFARMQMQQQPDILSNRQSMLQQPFVEMRHNMLELARNEQTMQNTWASAGSSGMMYQGNNYMNNIGQMSGQAQRLAQQQEYIAREQHRLMAEQERLVRQEHILRRRHAEMSRQRQIMEQQEMAARSRLNTTVNSFNTSHGEVVTDFTQDSFLAIESELDPLPFSDDYVIPLSMIPDTQRSAESSNDTAEERKEGASDARNGESKSQYINEGTRPGASAESKKSGETKAEESKDDGDQDSIDPKSSLLEYRKTLESYITNNQSSVPSLDIDDDGAGNSSCRVNGVETSDWIEQQLMNDSGELSGSTKGRWQLQRTNSKKSLMSLASSNNETMSFAFSDMEKSEELSKEENKKTTARSMSILSNNTALSELTDFDDFDCL